MKSLSFFLPKKNININNNRLVLLNTLRNSVYFNFKSIFLKKIDFVSSVLINNYDVDRFLNFHQNCNKIYFDELELVGLGYRVLLSGATLRLNLGFSHTICISLPNSIFILKKKSKILIYSSDLRELSNFVSKLLRFKKMNMYKLKGLKRKNDVFKLKLSKRVK